MLSSCACFQSQCQVMPAVNHMVKYLFSITLSSCACFPSLSRCDCLQLHCQVVTDFNHIVKLCLFSITVKLWLPSMTLSSCAWYQSHSKFVQPFDHIVKLCLFSTIFYSCALKKKARFSSSYTPIQNKWKASLPWKRIYEVVLSHTSTSQSNGTNILTKVYFNLLIFYLALPPSPCANICFLT